MAWQMPVYRQPTSFEVMVNDWLHQIQELLDYPLNSSEMLAHWWNHPRRQFLPWFSIVIWVSTVWFAYSTITSWRALRAEEAPTISQPALQDKFIANAGLPPQTPARRQSIPPLNGAGMNGSPSIIGIHIPFNIGKHVDDRTGRVSISGDHTPFVNNSSPRNFSGFGKTALVSYDTLRRNGLLDVTGTPTKKYSPAARNESNVSPDEEQSDKVLGTSSGQRSDLEESRRQAEGVEAQ